MSEHVASILAQLGQEPSDILQAAALPACWGFSATPSLQQLQHDLKTYQDGSEEETTAHNRRDRSHVEAPESYLSILESSNAFASNHCIDAMAEAYGVSQFVTSLSGSLLASKLADSAVAAAALQAVKQQVDQAWSAEAVKRGVGCAKSGDYQQALECYNKALDLHPGNCDAYVARGAAHANQKHFEAAIADFREALKLDPNNVNATKYLQATKEHMQATAATKEARHAAQEQHKQLQQQRPQQQQQQRLQQQAGNIQQHGSAAHQQNSHDALRRIAGSERQSPQQTRDIAKVDDERQQQRHQYHHKHSRDCSRSRSRSPSRGLRRVDRSSSSSDSSEQSSSSSDEQGVSAKALKRPSAADIKEAIELVRSAKKARRRDRHKSSGSSKKKKKHKHKHNSKHKHRKKDSR